MIDGDIAQALEQWLIVQMKERRGPGLAPIAGQPATDVRFSIQEMFEVLDELCPDVVGRMMQAGATKYLPDPEASASDPVDTMDELLNRLGGSYAESNNEVSRRSKP